MKIVAASDSSLLVVFGETISLGSHSQVLALFRGLQRRRDPRIRNLHPAYASLLIDFDPLQSSHAELRILVEKAMESPASPENSTAKTVTVPVCYDDEYGPDLSQVAAELRLRKREIIHLHASGSYVVYFLGFSPGFAYMGGLAPALRVPRLATPRTHVAAGTVAIAGEQTAVYPVESPGGWRLIGRTPLRIFDPEAGEPSKFQPGDQVRFTPIDRATFSAMSQGR